MATSDAITEGWLFIIGHSHYMRRRLRKRHFTLQGATATYTKKKLSQDSDEGVRTGVLDSYVRVVDEGRETVHGRVLHIFQIYDALNPNDQLKLGAETADDAAQWIRAFRTAAAAQIDTNATAAVLPSKDHKSAAKTRRGHQPSLSFDEGFGHRRTPSFRLEGGGRRDLMSEWTAPVFSPKSDVLNDLLAPANWRVWTCVNGLRIFKDCTSGCQKMGTPTFMAVGVIGTSGQSIFDAVMALGPSRTEWDFPFSRGRLLEHVDGHTDVVHDQFRKDWFFRGMKPRDLVLMRYWRREDDGSYVILLRSIESDKCPRRPGYVRADLRSGGFIITPLPNQGPGGSASCLVRHILEMDWRGSSLLYGKKHLHDLSLRLLQRVAGLREMFACKPAGYTPLSAPLGPAAILTEPSSRRLMAPAGDRASSMAGARRGSRASEEERPLIDGELPSTPEHSLLVGRQAIPIPPPRGSTTGSESGSPVVWEGERRGQGGVGAGGESTSRIAGGAGADRSWQKTPSGFFRSAVGDEEEEDEEEGAFFDVPSEAAWVEEGGTSGRRWQAELEGFKEGSTAFGEDTGNQRSFLGTKWLRKIHHVAEAARKRTQSLTGADLEAMERLGSLARGSVDHNDRSRWSTADYAQFLIRSPTYLQDRRKMVASEPYMDLVAADWFKSDKREDHLAARPGFAVQRASKAGDPFFWVFNVQTPGTTQYSLAFTFAMYRPIDSVPLFEQFVNSDDRYRSSRFKLIPYINKGNWIVKQSVGKTACLIGEQLEINYFKGDNYLEMDINIGSSSIARGVVGLVLGYLSTLVIDMAFVVQANTDEELPEALMGTCRIIHLEVGKAVPPPPPA